MMPLSTYPNPHEMTKENSLNIDTMNIDTAKSPGFFETLIQQILNEPMETLGTDRPHQNKRWSVAPSLNTYSHEEEITPECERAVIARYRKARHSLPEDHWWKLDSKHRIRIAALEKMEESDTMDAGLNIALTPESRMEFPTYNESLEVAKNSESTPPIRPEILEALSFTHTPNSREVKPIGDNGLELESADQITPSLARPLDCNAAAWECWQNSAGVTDLQRHAYHGARFAAYSFDNGDIFNIHDPLIRQRLRQVEECWQQGKAAMNVETQFWNAVYERQYQPDNFSQRDAYLVLAIAIEFAAKMFIYNQSESDVHNYIFMRCLTTAFDCPKEDQGGLMLDIPGLSNILLLKFNQQAGNEQSSELEEHESRLYDTTKRFGLLRFH
jgi:hypothetical protein